LSGGVHSSFIGEAEHFWQKRYYDFNIRNYPQFVEKLRYIHHNPVKAGLCERPQDWE
jgi:putative transposase